MNVTVFNLIFLVAAVGFVAYFLTRKTPAAPEETTGSSSEDNKEEVTVDTYPEEVTVIDYAPE